MFKSFLKHHLTFCTRHTAATIEIYEHVYDWLQLEIAVITQFTFFAHIPFGVYMKFTCNICLNEREQMRAGILYWWVFISLIHHQLPRSRAKQIFRPPKMLNLLLTSSLLYFKVWLSCYKLSHPFYIFFSCAIYPLILLYCTLCIPSVLHTWHFPTLFPLAN